MDDEDQHSGVVVALEDLADGSRDLAGLGLGWLIVRQDPAQAGEPGEAVALAAEALDLGTGHALYWRLVMMPELAAKIGAYAGGTLSRAEFESWFYELSSDVEAKHAPPTVDAVHEVEGLLAESSSGGWSEADLRRELECVLRMRRATLVA